MNGYETAKPQNERDCLMNATAKEGSQTSVERMDNAIHNLYHITDQLLHLRLVITGGRTEEAQRDPDAKLPEEVQPEPALRDILTTGPARINEQKEVALDLIGEIRQLLMI